MYFHTYENIKMRKPDAGLLASAVKSGYDSRSIMKDQTA
jgi:hypothetical protein